MTNPICRFSARSETASDTESLGEALGGLLAAGDVVCLCGDLGAGKTVFSRGVGAGWGACEPLTSPTFIIAQEHRRGIDEGRLIHLDFYRVCGAAEAEALGIDDMLDGGAILLMEWAERIEAILPPNLLWIDFSVTGDEKRLLDFEARGERFRGLLGAFAALICQRGETTMEDDCHAAGD